MHFISSIFFENYLITVILSFLKRELERDFANVSDCLSCTVWTFHDRYRAFLVLKRLQTVENCRKSSWNVNKHSNIERLYSNALERIVEKVHVHVSKFRNNVMIVGWSGDFFVKIFSNYLAIFVLFCLFLISKTNVYDHLPFADN